MTEAVWAVERYPLLICKIVEICMLKHALLDYLSDLKSAQMNVQHSLIQELMLYQFKQGHNAVEETKKKIV